MKHAILFFNLFFFVSFQVIGQDGIFVTSGETVFISAANTLTVQGNLINNGTISGSGILSLSGSSAQTMSGTGTVKHLTVNNAAGVTVASGSNLGVYGILTPTAGIISIHASGNLILKSTATEEATIGTVASCSTEPIVGNITLEKYIPAKRAFRFLTPGVTTSTTINANWQEGSSINSTVGYPYAGGTTQNPTSGYGTHIMGTGGATNGFDLSISNSPSLFTFNVSSYAWVAEANTHVAGNVLQRGEAYRLFVRGDRGANLNTDAEAATATTIRTKGVLKVCESMSFTTTSPIVPLSSVAGRYSFIGNPYWSVVDWHAVTKTNVEENLYYWDPTISGTNGRGAYITYNQATLSNNTAGSLADRYIQPGQAFFVRNNSNVDGSILPTVTFDATDIVGTSPTRTAIFSRNDIKVGEEAGMLSQERMQPAVTSAIEKIYVSLLIKSKPGTGPADGFLVAYNQGFTDTYGKEDAAKFSNLDENITAVYNGSRQSILGLKAAMGNEVKSDTIPISMTNLYDGEYVVKVSIDKSVNPAREVYVLNRMTGQQIKVDHTNGLELSFLNALGVKAKEDLVLVVNSRSSEPELPAVKKLLLYPNPVTGGVVSLRVPMGELKPAQLNASAKVEIRNTNKRLVFKQQVQLDNQGRATLNIGTLSGGMYVVKVSIGNKSFTAKMVKL
jgi:hypothetical protein